MLNAFDIEDTIVAVATAREPGAARGIVRVSGPNALRAISGAFQASGNLSIDDVSSPTVLSGRFKCDGMENSIACEVAVWPNQQSYTNQVAAEIHTIGSLPILDAILEQLRESGCRLAEPGEFTMRAFLSGRLDLTEAEAVLGVIDAVDKSQLTVALEQLSGGLAKPLDQVRAQLIESLAHLEAGLDFVEEDIEFISNKDLMERLASIKAVVETVGQQISSRHDTTSLPEVVLFGSPNAGKSSLFNALISLGQSQSTEKRGTETNSAIVSEISGTTRDYVSAEVMMNGLRCQLVDTAGVEDQQRVSANTNEAGSDRENQSGSIALGVGQASSHRLHGRATLELFCIDSTRKLFDWEKEYLSQERDNRIICLTKCDQCQFEDEVDDSQISSIKDALVTSAANGSGIESLRAVIEDFFADEESSESVIGTSVRCSASIAAIMESLSSAIDLATNQRGDEFIAAELRIALHEIGRVTGVVYTDDILDVVFGQFCIGK